ncbi:MAG: STAS domain-containing protein [Lysobacter sp.]|nr:STAS domain-containing protein [Lysobacter sp.]
MAPAAASVVRDGDTLRFGGALLRDHVATLWRALPGTVDGIRAPDIRTLDLSGVDRIDSAGLALVSLLAARCDGAELRGVDTGAPEGFAELREAYRLGHGLAFVRD